MTLRLDATYVPVVGRAGDLYVRIVNAGPEAVPVRRLHLTSVVPLTPHVGAPTTLVDRTSGHHVLAPPDGLVLAAGGVWELDGLSCGHRLRHANDGPASAYVVLADGSARSVVVGATQRREPVRVGPDPPPALCLADSSALAAAAWVAAAACERRIHPHEATVLSGSGTVVSATIVHSTDPDVYRIEELGGRVDVVAGSSHALQWAFLTLARDRRGELPPSGGAHEPARAWRGLHVDLARQFIPALDVEWVIEIAAWLRLNRLHLHLTDDEAWRVPIEAYPALTEIGAWRGHGLAIPPLLGAGPEPTGGSYTRADIRRWVVRAAELGIEIIPEVDLPGHSFAALAAVPSLRDPDDDSGAPSVQHFVDNVLNPGVAATWPFIDAVFGELADLFPAPWLHLGGDEVSTGAWRGSPAARRWASQRGVDGGSEAIGAAFVREVVAMIGSTTGRSVGVWQDAADGGAIDPGAAYVVAWRSTDDVRRLVAGGHDVVASPAPLHYLDMALDTDWHSPGASWAGHATAAEVAAFDVTAGWSADERARLLGVQACLWTEHVHDRAGLERLLRPRLDVIADAAWRHPIRN